MTSLGLAERTGWPDDLRHLLERYPRKGWQDHANLGDMAKFWLARHDMFRDLSEAMVQATAGLRDGSVPADQYRQWFAPRLNFLLSELQTHHMIEDRHYFPVFMRAESSLARGFEVLESDHDTIHQALSDLARSGKMLAGAIDGRTPLLTQAAEGFSDVSDGFLTMLNRHLADEEDLIIPVILERTESALGIG